MNYKGYLGNVIYDDEARLFHGEVVGLRDVITFQGTSVQELERAFKDSVNDYIAWCKERGEKPEKSLSGYLEIKITPDLHAKLFQEATSHGLSLNSFITEKLKK